MVTILVVLVFWFAGTVLTFTLGYDARKLATPLCAEPTEMQKKDIKWGARLMIFCWAWPVLLAIPLGKKSKNFGFAVGRVFRDGMGK